MSEGLKFNTSLVTLYLGGNDIKDEEFRFIRKIIQRNVNYEYFILPQLQRERNNLRTSLENLSISKNIINSLLTFHKDIIFI